MTSLANSTFEFPFTPEECEKKKQLIYAELDFIFHYLSRYFDLSRCEFKTSTSDSNDPWTVIMRGYDTDQDQIYLPYEIHLTGHVCDDQIKWQWTIYSEQPNMHKCHSEMPIGRSRRILYTLGAIVNGGRQIVYHFLSHIAMPVILQKELAQLLRSFRPCYYMFYVNVNNTWNLAIKHADLLYIIHVNLVANYHMHETAMTFGTIVGEAETEYMTKDENYARAQYLMAASQWSLTIEGNVSLVRPIEGRTGMETVVRRLLDIIKTYRYNVKSIGNNNTSNNEEMRENENEEDEEDEDEDESEEDDEFADRMDIDKIKTRRIVTAKRSHTDVPIRPKSDVSDVDDRTRKVPQRRNNKEEDDEYAYSLANPLYRPYRQHRLVFDF